VFIFQTAGIRDYMIPTVRRHAPMTGIKNLHTLNKLTLQSQTILLVFALSIEVDKNHKSFGFFHG
jgi:hypothetical protein